MLMLMFKLGSERYALDCRWVVEIVPLVPLAPVPKAPEYIAGLFNYRGIAVPVVDLCQLTKKRACRPHLSSRIVLLDYERLKGGAVTGQPQHILGVIAEQVTEVHEVEGQGTPPPLNIAQAPYLGDIFFVAAEMNQRLEPAALLPDELQELLFSRKSAAQA